MEAIILGSNNTYPADVSIRITSHPVFNIFKQAQFGKLQLQTPDGTAYTFGGVKPGPVANMKLKNPDVLDVLLTHGEIGCAETYMAKLWDTDNLPNFLMFILANIDVMERYIYGHPLRALITHLKSLRGGNSLKGSKRNISKHYDLGNDFYSLWLDKSMTYSCALFGNDKSLSLEEAQQAKYQRILNKLNPVQGGHILEIGCGWGGFAEFAARKGYKVTSITISEEQKKYAEERISRCGLDGLAKIELKDYRKITGKFDYIVSIGMFEHVGGQYWPIYFNTIKSCLKPGGRAMVQTITIDGDVFKKTRNKHGFIERFIFPGGLLPSKAIFRSSAENSGLQCKEIFAFGQDYALTLKNWLKRFEEQRENIRRIGFDESFIRMWRFYLASCIATFTNGRTDVIQAEIYNPV